MLRKIALLSVLLVCSSLLRSEESALSWINNPYGGESDYVEWQWIESNEHRIFEVIASRRSLALTALEHEEFIEIKAPLSVEDYLGNPAPRVGEVANGYRPYLIRAVQSGTNGGFRVGVSRDEDVLVVYEQLGQVAYARKAALVVFLASKPNRIYVTTHSIM